MKVLEELWYGNVYPQEQSTEHNSEIKELINLIFDASINNLSLTLLFFAIGSPLGLNTIIYPETYGGSPKTGASMTLISSVFCVISIPVMYALITLIFGEIVI